MRSKYNNKKTTVDGITFDSKREAARYGELKTMLRAGLIESLELQKKFPIVINGVKVCEYRADFTYLENGRQVVEDAKGYATQIYKLKKKLLRAVSQIEIKEV